MVRTFLDRKKATVKELQILCGYLNFLNKAIIPGRAFTRHMYAQYSQKIDFSAAGLKYKTNSRRPANEQSNSQKLLLHYHIRLNQEFKLDCETWLKFLTDNNLRRIMNRPMIDVDTEQNSKEINFFSDASKSQILGFGCILGKKWIFGQWPESFIKTNDPSIVYLELFALMAGVLTWEHHLSNTRITVFCDNQSVVQMINNGSSSCKHCMKLIRMLTLNGLQFNRRLRCKFVRTGDNGIADSLSRLQFERFRRLVPNMNELPDTIDMRVWPINKLW